MKKLLLILTVLAGCQSVEDYQPKREPPPPYAFVGALYNFFIPICTVELVDAQIIVTAAHCMDSPGFYTVSFNDGRRHIRVGAWDLHPEWKEGSWSHDLAVAHLTAPAGIEPVRLRQEPVTFDPNPDEEPDLTLATVVSRSGGELRYDEDRWIIGKLEDTDLILWPDPHQFLRAGSSGGPLLIDGELAGVHILAFHEGPWQLSASTDVGANLGWLNERIKPNPG